MLPFWLSIAALSTVQGITVALPAPPPSWLGDRRPRSRAWAALPPLSIVAFLIAVSTVASVSTQVLTYFALVGVPLGAALALGWLMRGARPLLALLAAALFAVAWALSGSLTGQMAGAALVALSCATLGVLLAAVTPVRWLCVGIFAMAAVDAALVVSHRLRAPNSALNATHPAAHLPSLQNAAFGSAVMGYGDLFIAGVLGGLAACAWGRRAQLECSGLVVAFALAFDLLFFFVNELPATVPVAGALAVMLIRRRSVAARRAATGRLQTPAASP